ncbi:hypothetical protein [Photobacterium halotolerans]|uniref:Uncharacterized protein n=1 Tax=Photobacterium halotolerans TaxID=265726 RepID=A0A0F5VCK3_9GAMM|nr:hypothetical protein [Photobacterium halotolerans]KKC99807.1 hypothetical protein KY46_11395 [Photobacterium halotolerans]
MSDEVKKITREKFKLSLLIPFLLSFIMGHLSYNHFLEASAKDFSDERVLTYTLAVFSGMMSLVMVIAVIRGVLILMGVIQGKVEFVDEN